MMSSPSLEFALVRILIDDQSPRKPVGAGFLVTPRHLLTCAHVINDALGRQQHAADQPDELVYLDFPLLPGQPLLQAEILRWFPVKADSAVGELEDIAVLELPADATLPAGARPAPIEVLDHKGSFLDDPVRMCGFPAGVDDGTYANGVLQGRTAKGWVEIHHQDSNIVEQGFSGTAVWAVEENAVCGMTVSMLSRREATVAYMIPALSLLEALPAIDEFNRAANPYRGLKAFREQDARFYFGRNEAADLLRQAADRQPFTAVIGASGSGKSSLVFAGLLPMLSKQGGWLTAACRPKSQPFDELAACLIPFLYEDELERIRKTKDCAAELLAGKLSLTDLLRPILSKNSGARLLLIVDQFEELFTLNPDKELVRRYLEGLLAAGQSEGFAALVTMRADFLGAAIAYDLLAEAMNKHRPIMIPPMSGQGLREAVERPALLLHVRFEPGLAELIVQDVGNEPGSLPLLEFCLSQLWEKQQRRQITHEAYKELGGVQQALAVHAEAMSKDFDEQQVRQIFLKLVRPGQGTEDTRQVAALADFQEEQRGLIRQLADRRLLVTSGGADGKEETVEVVHEALIRCWKKLRQWVDKEREFLVWREKLKVLLKQWQESGELLRGLPLDQALKWRASHENYLSEEERQFIRESEKAREKQRRRKIIAVSVGLLLAVAVAVVFFLLWKNAEKERVRAEEQKQVAEQQKSKAEQQTLAAKYNLAKAFEEKALNILKTADNEGAWAYKQAVLSASAALRQEIEAQQEALAPTSIGTLFSAKVFRAALSEQWVFRGHDKGINSVAFSPDGKRLASASQDKTVRLIDAESGKELNQFYGHNRAVNSVSFSSDGQRLASASEDKTVRVWDAKSGKEITVFRGHTDVKWVMRTNDGRRSSVAFSPDGKKLASTSLDDKTVRVWDAESGKELVALKGHTDIVHSVIFSPDGKWLASGSEDKTVRIWDAGNGKELSVIKGHDGAVFSTKFSPDSKRLASASRDMTVRVWNSDTGKELAKFKHHATVVDVAFSPCGRLIASASLDKTVWLWDAESGKELIIYKGHTNWVNSVAFSPDGKKLASASSDKTVRVWDAEMTTLWPHDVVGNVAFSPDGKRLAAASRDKTIRLWDTESKKELTICKGHDGAVRSVAFSPDGKRLASASQDKTIRLWDAKSGKELKRLEGHTDTVNSVAFSPEGRRLASASEDKTVRTWDTESKKELTICKGHDGAVRSVAFSPDGKRLASASQDKMIRLWDADRGNELSVYKGHDETVSSVAFSRDGKLLASASFDKTVRVWNLETKKEIKKFEGHKDFVNIVIFNHDNKIIVSADSDHTIRLWDAATSKELSILTDIDRYIKSVTFSPDGRHLASVSLEGTARLRDMRPYSFFMNGAKPTPLYYTFIEAVKFLWELDVQGLEIVHKERTQADIEKFGALLAPPPPGQSKFDQVLEWAEKQQGGSGEK